jgi:hypothetical protein
VPPYCSISLIPFRIFCLRLSDLYLTYFAVPRRLRGLNRRVDRIDVGPVDIQGASRYRVDETVLSGRQRNKFLLGQILCAEPNHDAEKKRSRINVTADKPVAASSSFPPQHSRAAAQRFSPRGYSCLSDWASTTAILSRPRLPAKRSLQSRVSGQFNPQTDHKPSTGSSANRSGRRCQPDRGGPRTSLMVALLRAWRREKARYRCINPNQFDRFTVSGWTWRRARTRKIERRAGSAIMLRRICLEASWQKVFAGSYSLVPRRRLAAT